QKSSKTFVRGIETETYGYNGDYLGPVIRAKKGEEVTVHIQNDLGEEETTVHWHGLEIPGDVDGGRHQVIAADESMTTKCTLSQRVATLCYHPQPLHNTAEQVYNELAGLLLIEDQVSQSVPIPDHYAVNDFPLIIQDRNLNEAGQL